MRKSKIAIVYHSHSGNTAAAAEAVAEGVRADSEIEVLLVNADQGRPDPALLGECAAAAFGTPDYFSYPAGTMKTFMDDWLIAKRQGNEEIEDLPVGLFVTHGGGGAARQPFEELFGRIGPQVGETVMIKGRPGEPDLQSCRKLGAQLVVEGRRFLEEAD